MKNTNKIYILISLIVGFSILKFLVLDNKYTVTISSYILTAFWVLLCFLSLIMLKYPKDSALYKKNADRMVVISLLATILSTYLLGFFVGFTKNGYLTSFNVFFTYFTTTLFIKICREVIRYSVAKNSTYKLKPLIIFTAAVIFFELLIAYKNTSLLNGELIFYFVSITVLPCIAENLLCSYLAYNFGIETVLLYALPYNLYGYVLPFIPELGNFINSVVFIMLPFIIYMLTIKIVRYQNKEKVSLKQNTRNLFAIPIIAFLSVLAILVSGLLRYRLIAIASDSMNPVFYRGDGIIYKNIRFVDKVEVGDVIAFKNSGMIITHRVLGIVESPEKRIYKTKGDNNNVYDDYDVEDKDVIGVVKYVIKYIGFPTVWFSENIKKIKG